MTWLIDWITNPCIVACFTAWLTAQVIKVIIHTVVYKEFKILRLFGDGGMPSAHTALVTSMATMCGLTAGFGSAPFAVAFVLTVVVCRDAVGIRRQSEKQAKMLNFLVDTLDDKEPDYDLPDERLNTFIGHSPTQMVVGAIVGIGTSLLLYFFVL